MIDVESNLDILIDALDKDRRGKGLRREAALEGGAALLAIKASVKHGDFLPMVAAKGISDRKAQRWMAKAEQWQELVERGKGFVEGHRQGCRDQHSALGRMWENYNGMFDYWLTNKDNADVGITQDKLNEIKGGILAMEAEFIADNADDWEGIGLPGNPPYRVEIEAGCFIPYRTNAHGKETRGEAIPNARGIVAFLDAYEEGKLIERGWPWEGWPDTYQPNLAGQS